jgi:hypothetical protein
MRYFGLAVACSVLLITACDNDQRAAQPVVASKIGGGSYVFVDTTGYVLVKALFPGQRPEVEVYLWWERNFGEPFGDVNGDGDYDPGIDIFIYSTNPALNMDLNYNSRYDGPDDPWSPGIPFDDVDGNGTLRLEADAGENYSPAVPFCDHNENGQWDSAPAFTFYRMARCRSVGQGWGRVSLEFNEADSAWYRFRSDSGVVYDLRGHSVRLPNWWYLPDTHRIPGLAFQSSPRGLSYTNQIDNVSIDIANTDLPISVDDEDYSIVIGGSAIPCDRSVRYEQTLDTLGIRLDGLLEIAITNLKEPQPPVAIPRNAYWIFYFRKTEGLVAMHCSPYLSQREAWIFLDSRTQSLPCLMQRLSR